jgi:hypothetical protein
MYATEDELTPSESGYATPPLSPTKTISTEGWSSPRTPGSPRKSRSCLFIRNIDHELGDPFFTPPPSPTKPKCAPQLGALSIPEVLSPTYDPTSPDLTDDSPVKQDVPLPDLPSSRRPPNISGSTNRSLPDPIDHCTITEPLNVPLLDVSRAPRDIHMHDQQRRPHRSSSESSMDALIAKYATPPTTPADIGPDSERDADQPTNNFTSPTKLHRLPVRCSSSPLRPSQWASRGGLLLPPRKSQMGIPDRFIHCRRPPAVTRESFELSKPIERVQISRRGYWVGGDPFSHRVRRSDRLNAELRGLREAHAIITGRPGGNVRSSGLRLRNSSLVTAARQISAGAVWNVGGTSAVGDTVAAVPTGNGGMLGSGTTAPLYTCTFLNRADPEAELEAYERRLALALEVDQTDRILQHTPLPSIYPGARHNNAPPYKPHFWRDSAWAQDDVKPCLFGSLPGFHGAYANGPLKLHDDHTKGSGDPCRSYLLDMSQPQQRNFISVDTSLQSSMHLNCGTTTTAPCLRTLTPLNVLQWA